MPRRNPPLPPAPPKRRFRGAPVTTQKDRNALARVRQMASSLDERDRPFNPERPGTWRGSSRDLVVNGGAPRMFEGDALALRLSDARNWDDAPDSSWYREKVERTQTSGAIPVGTRKIRGESYVVFMNTYTGDRRVYYYAQLESDVGSFERNGSGSDGTWAHTATQRVWVPEVQFDQGSLPHGATIEPLRGYGHTMAVMDSGGNCIGWIVMSESVARGINTGRVSYARNSGSMTVKGVRLDPFTVAFLEAALWSSNDESREDGGDPLDQNYGIGDFTQKSLRELADDCAKFQEENAEDLQVGDDEQAGHDFWLNRNGHGSGFWDGDWPEPQASRLDKASKNFGEVNLYVTDGGEVAADFMRPTHRRNGKQQLMPWGSRRPGKFEVPMPDFDWEQVDGDVNLPAHGGIIARCEGGQIDLVEIQPVRAYVGDSEAADVGYPFWTKEASFTADELDPSNEEVRRALQSSDLDLDEVDDEHLATAIAVALMRYGHSEEGNGGWAADKKPGEEGMARVLGTRKVRWGYAGIKRTTFIEEAADEDDEFRREVLDEEDEDEE